MAIGDTLLFTVRGPNGTTDVEVELIDFTTQGGSVVLNTAVLTTEASGFGPSVDLRFFAQQPDASFNPQFTVTALPVDTITPSVEFPEGVVLDTFSIGVTVAPSNETPAERLPDEQALSVDIDPS